MVGGERTQLLRLEEKAARKMNRTALAAPRKVPA
jgi:hypothetical protein